MTTAIFLIVLLVVVIVPFLVSAESFDLHLPQNSQGHAIASDISDMLSFSVCVWLRRTIPAGKMKPGYAFSYSNSAHRIALGVETIDTRATIFLDDGPFLFPNFQFQDGQWHHICVVMNQNTLLFRVYKEGVRDLSTPMLFRKEKGLKGGGTLVIGARKKVDGTLINLFKGSISNLNIWDRAFDEGEIRKLFLGCEAYRGNVLPWCETIIGSMIKHEVYIKSPSTACASSYADATFTREINIKLIGHVVDTKTVRDELSCALSCLQTCICKSFNMWRRPDDTYYCELNRATLKQFPQDLLFTDGVTYHGQL